MTSIKFGTEGWRGIMAEDFTTENVRRVTQAIAEHLLEGAHPPLAVGVGYDTRFLSERFARSVCEVLAGNQIKAILSNRCVPTCAVSRFIVHKQLQAGIMITASHNPPIYNGVKVKEAFGGSATSQSVTSIERRIGRSQVESIPFEEASHQRWIVQDDLLGPYLQGIRAFVDLPAMRRSNLKVVVDSMYGAGERLIEGLLKGGRCRVETLHGDPDPRFGNQAPEPIASHLVELSRRVRLRHAAIGIANDGDADRLGIIDPTGKWLSPGQILCILLAHFVKTRKAKGAVVKTVSNTMMINRMTQKLGLRLIEVPVGFKHIAQLMIEGEILMGGEESGGIGITEYLPERDGVLNGLLVLEAMACRRASLTTLLEELERAYGQWTYGRQDLQLAPAQVETLFTRLQKNPPEKLSGVPVVRVDTRDGVKLMGADDRWLLFRRSGTEPIVRIYAETPHRKALAPLLELGVKLASAI